ncbi:uncharacterized protein LOC107642100 isoform X1 [Arachis ipaensis]|nr:uncharacterized protein LOC107642100 isoform X1 [Arachis ipaensis]
MWMYETLFTCLGVRIPFSDFQQDVLKLCGCAPSQMHPNSWAIIRGFELLCSFLDFPISTRVFFYFFNFAISFGACGQGFLSFQANHNHRIFNLFEESYHGFKEKYFKVERVSGSQPFFMTSENEKRFNLYWNFHVASPKIELKGMNPIERDIIHTLLGLWNDNPLDLRMILADVQASKNVVVKMVGGTEAITAMRRKLGTNTISTNTEGRDMISSSTIHGNLSPPEPQKSTIDIEILDAHPPSSSLVRKKQKSKDKRLNQ